KTLQSMTRKMPAPHMMRGVHRFSEKDDAETIRLERDDDLKKSHHVLTGGPPNKNPAIRGGVQSGGVSLAARHKPCGSGGDELFDLVRLAQHVAAAPHGLDEVAAFGSVRQLLAQLADEDVDDLELGLVHAAI